MNRILEMRRRVASGYYDDPEVIRRKLRGTEREAFLRRVGIDDPDVVAPESRSAAAATIVLALACGGGLVVATIGWVAWQLLTWLRGA